MKNYKLYLFRPVSINKISNFSESNFLEDFLGELKVHNLQTTIKLQEISTISFDIPETVLGEFNTRIDEVLDNYIVELWYGDLNNPTKQRFIITKSPLEFDEGVKRYCYEGLSLEHLLEYRQLANWPGIRIQDFYRTISYDGSLQNFSELDAAGDVKDTYTIELSTFEQSDANKTRTKYITVPTTTGDVEGEEPGLLDIFIYQYRRNSTDTVNSETSLIEYRVNEIGGTDYENEEGFKPGFYIPVVNANNKVTEVIIALPNDIDFIDDAGKNFEIFLYDNPLSRHFAIGINTNELIQASNMYLDLAQDGAVKFDINGCNATNASAIIQIAANDPNAYLLRNDLIVTGTGIPASTTVTAISAAQSNIISITISNNFTGTTGKVNLNFSSANIASYNDFAFTTQLIYSNNGLKLLDILTGDIENQKIYEFPKANPENYIINEDGILYNTGFTIGQIHPDIHLKYRSNIELNNITKYAAIKNLAESFDAIPIFNSIEKTVSFYPDKNEEAFDNNGLIITRNNYLKSLTNDIDSSKIVTKVFPLGKDNLTINLITPNATGFWENYSYFMDSWYVEFNQNNLLVMTNNANTGVSYSSFPIGNLSRWMTSGEAEKLAKWQYARDYFHNIMLGNLDPTIVQHDRYYDLYNLRSEAINNLVKEESKYFELKATEYKYKYLYEYYVKQNDNAAENTRQRSYTYDFDDTATPGSERIVLNDGNFSESNSIILHNTNKDGDNVRTFLQGITREKNPRIVLDGPTNTVFYKVTGPANTTNPNYITIPVFFISKNDPDNNMYPADEEIEVKFDTWEELYLTKYEDAEDASAAALSELDKIHFNIYNSRFDGSIPESSDDDYNDLVVTIQPNSFFTKLSEVQSFLLKSRWDINDTQLKAFEREAVMSDSNLDNELDLMTTAEEYLVENSRPVITLDIDVVDFLASYQSSVDWDKVVIGEIVNIYFPDFNVDNTAQLREIQINFQDNSLKFTISTYRQYKRLPGSYLFRKIRSIYDNDINLYSSQYDSNNYSTEIAGQSDDPIVAGDTPVNTGATDGNGEYSTTTDGDGITSDAPDNVDPELETFVFTNEKTISIYNGNFLARNIVRDESDVFQHISEIEISGDNGIVIRKIEADGTSLRQMYIDTDGNAVFSGFLSVNQEEGNIGFNNEGIFAGEANETSKFSLVSGNTFMKFDPDGVDYKLVVAGEAKIGPLIIGNATNGFGILDNILPIEIYGSNTNPQSINKTYNFGAINTIHPVYKVELNSLMTTQTLDGITNRTIRIELYQVLTGGTTLVYSSETQTIPNQTVSFSSNINTFDINSVPAIQANRIIVYVFANTAGSPASAVWRISAPNVSIAKSSIEMGLFNVDSLGLLQTQEATFGINTMDRIKIAPSGIPESTSNAKVITIRPTTSGTGITADRTIIIEDKSGSLVINEAASPNTNVLITASNSANITATNSITLTTTSLSGDITLNASDDIVLKATDQIELASNSGVRFFHNTTTSLYTEFIPSTVSANKSITIPNASGTLVLAPVKIGSDLSLGSGSNGTVTVTGYNYILIKIFRGAGGVNHIGDTLINLGDTNEFSTTIRTRYIVWHEGGLTVNGNITVQSSSGLRIVNNLGSGTTTFRVYGIV
jgi:hypothetical protein